MPELKRNNSAIIFDHDGTLVHSIPAVVAASNAVRQNCGLAPASEASIVAGMVLPTAPRMGALCDEADPEKQQQLASDFYLHARALADRAELYDGVQACLQQCVAAGYRLGMVSNNEGVFIRKVAALTGLVDSLPVLFGEEDVAAVKPSGLGIIQCAAGLAVRCTPQRVCYVGDAITDLQAARAAQVYALGVTWGTHSRAELEPLGFDALIDHPRELLPALQHAGFAAS